MKEKKLHFSPKKNWMNDPNGLCYYKGEYHLYYQYFPYGNKWGTMHWGHATTTNFIDWTHHDMALFPTIDADRNGCFSGSAVVLKDGIDFYYTGVRYLEQSPKNVHIPKYESFDARQLHIHSKDGYTFDNYNDKSVVVDVIDDKSIGHPIHTRDPKVWIKDDVTYMILGTKVDYKNDFKGGILLYKKNNDKFELIDTYYDENIGNMWECPDYFDLTNGGYLIISPEMIIDKPGNYTNNSVIIKANIDYKKEKITVDTKWNFLDYGLDFYAPQTFIDENNNRVMFGWLRMVESFDGKSIGQMTMPRVVTDINGMVKYSVHPLIESRFSKEVKTSLNCQVKVSTTINVGDEINVKGLEISYKNNKLIFNRSAIHPSSEIAGNIFEIEGFEGEITLDMYIDSYVIETFINEGEKVCSLVVSKLEDKIITNNEVIIKELADE